MSDALFLFTIGPVKSFIQPSRKMRDLYAGSYFLSRLMKEVVDKISRMEKEQSNGKGIEIVLPAATENVNVPNRLVAIITGYNETEQKQLGKKLETFVRKKFNTLCNQVFQHIGVNENKMDSIHQQLERFLEVYWLFQEYEQGQYKEAYTSMVANMNSIKTVRAFVQSKECAGRKCDLYPEYNAMFVKKRNDKLPAFVDNKQIMELTEHRNGKYKYELKPGESLSAIAFVKRMLDLLLNEEKGYVLKVTSVAYMLLEIRLGEKYGKELNKIKDQASEAVFDLQNGQQLSTDEYSKEQIEVAKELYEKIKDKIRISPYYALVKFDGDGIGSLYQQYPNKKEHKQLSRDISVFARKVGDIITSHKGICIYAGGEDFLGFLPLDTLFPAMMKLHKTFPSQIKSPKGHPNNLTFSAGILIAHLMDPLQTILARVEELETYAKEIDNEKNAFAIELIKRSGDPIPFRCKFGEEGKSLQLIYHAIQKLNEQQYSKSFIHNLSHMLERLNGLTDGAKSDMVRALIQQALQRSNPTLSHAECIEHTDVFYELYTLVHTDNNNMQDDIAAFIHVLQLLAFLSREVETCSIPSMR